MPGRLLSTINQSLNNSNMDGPQLQGHAEDTATATLNGVRTSRQIGQQMDVQDKVLQVPHTKDAPPSAPGSNGVFGQLPPEIEHVTLGFQPLSKLLERAAQDCFRSLNETISELASVSIAQPSNGVTTVNHAEITSTLSAEKRVRWLNFASRQRERFIKLVVLLQWSRRVDDVSKLIDLHVWLHQQTELYEGARWWMGELKRSLSTAKLPNPDIDTALEVLSSGKSALVPEFGYIPPEPMSPKKLLDTLQNLNILLHIRLNLHEKLPHHFKDFSISSGRATFVVPSEFEVDLSIADEDVSSQLYCIDFRFLFTPHVEIPTGQLRSILEARVNQALAQDGLTGCFSLLHDFVLTHKINLLRKEALELSTTSWAGALRIEQLHRSLVVQYWLDRPGPKHWFEIGVASGKQTYHVTSSTKGRPSELAIRWMPGGKEAKYTNSPPDILKSSLESILNTTIAHHTSAILFTISTRIASENRNISQDGVQSIALTTLQLKLGPLTSLTGLVLIEPVTGSMQLRPATSASARCEAHLNSLADLSNEAGPLLQLWQASEWQSSIEENAQRFGWVILSDKVLDKSSVSKSFGIRPVAISLFKKWASWIPWVVIALIDHTGDSWCIAELGENTHTAINDRKANAARVGAGECILTAEKLPSQDTLLGSENAQAFFANLETLSIAGISYLVIRRRLKALHVPHSFDFDTSDLTVARLTISATELIKENVRSRPLLSSVLSLKSCGLDRRAQQRTDQVWIPPEFSKSVNQQDVESAVPKQTDRGGQKDASSSLSAYHEVVYLVKGNMNVNSDFLNLLKSGSFPDVEFDQWGNFALVLRWGLGAASLVNELIDRLTALLRLRTYARRLRFLNFECSSVTLTTLIFKYASEENDQGKDLQATVSYANHAPAHLAFSPINTNPHRRVETLLARLLKSASSPSAQSSGVAGSHMQYKTAFVAFTHALIYTLPVLKAFSVIEARDRAKKTIVINACSVDKYAISYSRPNCTFDVSYVMRRDTGMWCVEQRASASSGRRDKLALALGLFFIRREVDGWIGFKNAAVARLDRISTVLLALDDVVKSCVDDGNEGTAIMSVQQPHEWRSDKMAESAAQPAPWFNAEPNKENVTIKAPEVANAKGRAKPKPKAKQQQEVVVID